MSKIRTIIVEDDPIFTLMLKDLLGNVLGKIDAATNSITAREMIIKEQPNIIFLDNHLPGINGIDLIDEFKQLVPECYIILMSSFRDVGEIAKSIQNGADDILSKERVTADEVKVIIEKIKNSKKSFDWHWLIPDMFKALPAINNHIAILDDDEIFTFHLKWILNNASENIVNSFVTSKSFFEFYETQTPDILFLDYYLPEGTGNEVIKEIKLKMPKTKVIMISSQEKIDIAINLKRDGAMSYISKNKNWREQLSTVMEELVI